MHVYAPLEFLTQVYALPEFPMDVYAPLEFPTYAYALHWPSCASARGAYALPELINILVFCSYFYKLGQFVWQIITEP